MSEGLIVSQTHSHRVVCAELLRDAIGNSARRFYPSAENGCWYFDAGGFFKQGAFFIGRIPGYLCFNLSTQALWTLQIFAQSRYFDCTGFNAPHNCIIFFSNMQKFSICLGACKIRFLFNHKKSKKSYVLHN